MAENPPDSNLDVAGFPNLQGVHGLVCGTGSPRGSRHDDHVQRSMEGVPRRDRHDPVGEVTLGTRDSNGPLDLCFSA